MGKGNAVQSETNSRTPPQGTPQVTEDDGDLKETIAVAFAFSYIGDAFHGSQIQPDVRTVQKDLLMAIWEAQIDVDKSALIISSRTDAGVTARMNVAKLNMPAHQWNGMGESNFRRAINDHLEDAVVWGAIQAPRDWNPRLAVRRIYRFRFEVLRPFTKPYDVDEVVRALSIFEGTHDFSGYSRLEQGREPIRTVDYCRPWWENGRLVGFEIAAQSFLWNQVRRIAASLAQVAQGAITIDELKSALNEAREPHQFGLAPSDWLTLWEIQHEGIEFPKMLDDYTHLLEEPPAGMDDRMYAGWSKAALLQQKFLMMRTWVAALKR